MNKVVFVGESNVGKTSILERQINKRFSDQTASVGIFSYSTTVDGVDLSIFDTAGQEAFHSLNNNIIRGASVVVIVFDLTDLNSFDQIKKYWLDFIINISIPKAIVIAGNKSDLDGHKVSLDQVKALRNEILKNYYGHTDDSIESENETKLNVMYFEVSAKEDSNIDSLFQYISYQVENNIDQPQPQLQESTSDSKCKC